MPVLLDLSTFDTSNAPSLDPALFIRDQFSLAFKVPANATTVEDVLVGVLDSVNGMRFRIAMRNEPGGAGTYRFRTYFSVDTDATAAVVLSEINTAVDLASVSEFTVTANFTATQIELRVNGETVDTGVGAGQPASGYAFDTALFFDNPTDGVGGAASVANAGSTINRFIVRDELWTQQEHDDFYTSGTVPGASNNNPVAADDYATTSQDTVLNSTVDLDANDTDLDGDTLSVTAETKATAQGGSITIAGDGSYAYTPAASFVGIDTVDYTVVDGNGGSDTGTLNIGVFPTGYVGGFLVDPLANPTALTGMAIGDLFASNGANFPVNAAGEILIGTGATDGDTFQTWFFDASTSTAYTTNHTYQDTTNATPLHASRTLTVSTDQIVSNGSVVPNDAPLYITPDGIVSTVPNGATVGSMRGVNGVLILENGESLSRANIYIGKNGRLTFTPNGRPVAVLR